MQEPQKMRVRSLGQDDAPGGGHGNLLQYSCLESPMYRGAWWVHSVAKSQIQVITEHKIKVLYAIQKDITSYLLYIAVCISEKAMATHSSTLAGRIPGSAEPGGLPSMGAHRVGHDWSNLAAAAAAVCIYRCQSPNLPLAPFPLGNHVCFLCLWLSSCFINRFMCTIFF